MDTTFTFSEDDFRPLANMCVNEKAFAYRDFSAWLDGALSQDVPKGVVAFNFNLYEDADQHWSVELVGTSKSDDEEDWACYDELFNNREQPFVWEENTECPRILAEAKDAIMQYLAEGRYSEILKGGKVVGVGFVSGDIEILYRRRGERKAKSPFWKSQYFYLAIAFVLMVVLDILLPKGVVKELLNLILIGFIILWVAYYLTIIGLKIDEKWEERRKKKNRNKVMQKREEIAKIMKEVDSLKRNSIIYGLMPKTDTPLPVGCSKYGGQPDVPEGFQWPRDDRGFPLALLLQVDCADIAVYDTEHLFPKSGHLYFFYELKEQDWSGMDNGVQVFYNDAPAEELYRLPRPKELDVLDDEFCLDERALNFSSDFIAPMSKDLVELLRIDADQYDFSNYDAGCRRFWESCRERGWWGTLSGYAEVIQNTMLSDTPKNDVLLMQMFSIKGEDNGYDLQFGDLGNIYFYVTRDELQRRDFSNVWFELQCD